MSGKSSKSKRKKHQTLVMAVLMVVDDATVRFVLSMPNTQSWWRDYISKLQGRAASADPINKFYRGVLHLMGKPPTARDITRLLSSIGKLKSMNKGENRDRQVVRDDDPARLPVVW